MCSLIWVLIDLNPILVSGRGTCCSPTPLPNHYSFSYHQSPATVVNNICIATSASLSKHRVKGKTSENPASTNENRWRLNLAAATLTSYLFTWQAAERARFALCAKLSSQANFLVPLMTYRKMK